MAAAFEGSLAETDQIKKARMPPVSLALRGVSLNLRYADVCTALQ